MLMNLGTLVTIAHAAPMNLVHCLCQNGTYETNGAVDIPGRGQVSFAGLAREAGYPKTYTFASNSRRMTKPNNHLDIPVAFS